MKMLRGDGVQVVIFEPTLQADSFEGYPVIHELESFKKMSDVIIANRYSEKLCDVSDKLYTRDVFCRD